MQLAFYILLSITVITVLNIIVLSFLHRLHQNSISAHALKYWLYILLSLAVHIVLPPKLHYLAAIFVYLIAVELIHILMVCFEKALPLRKFHFLFLTALAAETVFHAFGKENLFTTYLLTISVILPVLLAVKLIFADKSGQKYRPLEVMLALNALLFGLHNLTYPVIKPLGEEDPVFMVLGFGVALMINFFFSVLFPTVLNERAAENVKRKMQKANEFLEIELKNRTQTIVEQNMKLVEAAKYAALGQMAGGVAHEINNPLTTIGMAADQLARLSQTSQMDHEGLKKYIKLIQKTTFRIADIVHALKDVSLESSLPGKEDVDLRMFLERVQSLCAEKFKAQGIELSFVMEVPFTHTIFCNRTQMMQVLLSLLNNAYDAVLETKEKWIKVKVSGTPNFTILEVMDSGRGIKKEEMENIFVPFYSSKEVGKGVGLGLPISKKIIENHGGHLTLDTQLTYTNFVIHLPRRATMPRNFEATLSPETVTSN